MDIEDNLERLREALDEMREMFFREAKRANELEQMIVSLQARIKELEKKQGLDW